MDADRGRLPRPDAVPQVCGVSAEAAAFRPEPFGAFVRINSQAQCWQGLEGRFVSATADGIGLMDVPGSHNVNAALFFEWREVDVEPEEREIYIDASEAARS